MNAAFVIGMTAGIVVSSDRLQADSPGDCLLSVQSVTQLCFYFIDSVLLLLLFLMLLLILVILLLLLLLELV